MQAVTRKTYIVPLLFMGEGKSLRFVIPKIPHDYRLIVWPEDRFRDLKAAVMDEVARKVVAPQGGVLAAKIQHFDLDPRSDHFYGFLTCKCEDDLRNGWYTTSLRNFVLERMMETYLHIPRVLVPGARDYFMKAIASINKPKLASFGAAGDADSLLARYQEIVS